MSQAETMQVARYALAVDVVCFALEEEGLLVLLMRRADDPFAGCWALPGGLAQPDEDLDAAAARVLRERAGLEGTYLEQLYTFANPQRDPRGRTVSVSYLAVLPFGGASVSAGRGAQGVAWFRPDAPPPLAFDHDRILSYAVRRLRDKIVRTPLAFLLLPEEFTISDLRRVHERVLGAPIPHQTNFQTKMLARWPLLRVENARARRGRRMAQLYRYVGPREVPGAPPPAA
jgi:8-oxo-dGTP diphosphatase